MPLLTIGLLLYEIQKLNSHEKNSLSAQTFLAFIISDCNGLRQRPIKEHWSPTPTFDGKENALRFNERRNDHC